MNFTRRLTRELSDGEKIVVERVWQIRFLRNEGFTVSGSQISAEVQAPETLAALKRMEEAKIEKGMFPLRLDDGGLIIGGRHPSHQHAVQNAIDFAERRIAGLNAGAAAPDAKRFLGVIQQATVEHMSRIPRDLFCPQQLKSDETRKISLPDGTAGTVGINFEASMSRQYGLFEQAKRTVTTSLGNQTRESSVEWTLTSA